jgi:hypothetical protein
MGTIENGNNQKRNTQEKKHLVLGKLIGPGTDYIERKCSKYGKRFHDGMKE